MENKETPIEVMIQNSKDYLSLFIDKMVERELIKSNFEFFSFFKKNILQRGIVISKNDGYQWDVCRDAHNFFKQFPSIPLSIRFNCVDNFTKVANKEAIAINKFSESIKLRQVGINKSCSPTGFE